MISKALIILLSAASGSLLYSGTCPSCRMMGIEDSGTSAISAVGFGMIGLAASQTLRLSIMAYPPTPIFPPSPICVAQIGFANASGGAVGATKTVNLGPGQGDFLDLNGGTLALPSGGRAEARPVVTLLPSPAGGTSACLANAEILDTVSGYSLAVAPAITVFPPTPIFGLQGVALGQVLRLNVVAWPPDPCVAQLSFVDRFGNPAGPAPKPVNLSPGQADHLDVAGNSLVAQFGQRAELRPVIAIASGVAPSGCAATAEVYESISGRTWTWVAPGPSE